MATQYLIDQGHLRIACIAGPLDKTPARLRLEGYHAAMARCGLPVAEGYVVTSDFEFGGGFSAMQQLLALPQRPQAVCLSVTMRWRLALIRRYTRPGCRFRRIWRWWATMILSWHVI